MFIRKASFRGIKGIEDVIKLDFSPSDTSSFLSDNIETFGIEKNISKYSVLKQIGFIGLNSSGKTSILKGMQVGLAILSNPFNNMGLLTTMANIFNEKSFKWKFEIMTKVEIGTTIARKYIIDLEIDRNQIEHEKITCEEISKTSSKEPEVLYELKGTKLTVNGKSYNHNRAEITLFSLARTGQLNQEIDKRLEKYNDLFVGLDWVNDETALFSPGSQPSFFGQPNLVLPKGKKELARLNKLLRAFDENIVSIKANPMNVPIIEVKHGNKIKELDSVAKIKNVLSNGTFEFLSKNTIILTSITSKTLSFFDELDASIHSGLFKLIYEVLRLNSKSQIFFTTHNADIFSFNMRLDQINLIKKNDESVVVQKISEIDGIKGERNVTVKKIKRTIKNNPSLKIMGELLNFE